MKSKFFRFVSVCLVAILSLTLFVQSPAFAKREPDEGRIVAKRTVEELGGSGGAPAGRPSWWSRFRQGKPVRDPVQAPSIREGAERRNPRNDRERREDVKEVTGERHMPGGGPQDF